MRTWNRGTVWRDGKLYVFEPSSVLVMRLWPEMRAWRRTTTRQWTPTRKWADDILCGCPAHFLRGWSDHKGSFVGPLYETVFKEHRYLARTSFGPGQDGWESYVFDRHDDALEAALGTIPLREQKLAGRFAQRRWHALALMARCTGADDLLESNPALGFALANNWIFHRPAVKQPLRAARSLARRKQTAILDWLGFPPTERIRRILAKINPGALEARTLLHLQWALRDEAVQALLAHLPAISKDILRFVCLPDTRQRLTAKFLHQLAEESSRLVLTHPESSGVPFDATPQHFNRWVKAGYMARDVDRDKLATIHSLEQFQRWHDDLAEELQVRRAIPEALRHEIARIVFDPPPFPGTADIQPVRSAQELLNEGATMRHCVSSFCRRILDGTYYVYRVTGPVRATLAITRTTGRHWEISQLRGADNQPITPSDRAAIRMQLLGSLHSEATGLAEM